MGWTSQVAIVGAGPYGLAAAAHLRSAGVEACVFGEPMVFWKRQMPLGMFLRSSWEASHISDPDGSLTLDQYEAIHRTRLPRPVPLNDFIEYGEWFQGQVVPELDHRLVAKIHPIPRGFRLVLRDGDSLQVQRVVIAAGIAPFAYRPGQFSTLPSTLVSHTSDHQDLSRFVGQRVIVVGGGQSAVESAALLHEAGADVEVIVRAPRIRWLRRSAWLHRNLLPIQRLLYPPTDVGPPGLNQIVARPDFFKRLPRGLQHRIAYRSIRPAAAGWLFHRISGIQIKTGTKVVSAIPIGERLFVTLNDGTKQTADHILLATGYQVDVSRHSFLAPELLRSLRCVAGYPLLGAGFESSVPGLHFLGAPAAWSFGPLMRFVSGTGYTARALTRCLVGNAQTMVETEPLIARGVYD
jgi:thioredoxin reductase